jgi:hypothetical protein
MTKTSLFLLVLSSLCFTTTCGGNSAISLPTVHASGPQCFPENFYNGVQETPDYLWFATDMACDIGTLQDQSYTLKFNHTVQEMILQMGSNTGSIFEWDLVVTVTRPDGRQFSTQQQYDKHADNVGNRQVSYSYPAPQVLPAGTVINLHRRALAPGYCLQGGPWGTGVACATGQSVQLIGVLN